MILRKADALLMPSELDNFPNVGVEALATGTPIISLKNNGINELIKNFDNGVILDKLNIKNLSKVICWLNKIKKNKIKNIKISKNIKKIVSYSSVSSQLIKIYKQALNENDKYNNTNL